MTNITNLVAQLDAIISSYPFLLAVFTLFFSIKAIILTSIIVRSFNAKSVSRSYIFLILVLISSMISDTAWFLYLLRKLTILPLDFRIYLFWIRIAWGFATIQYQALALFIENLVEEKHILKIRHKVFLAISSIFFLISLGLAISNFNCLSPQDRPQIEFFMRSFETVYLLLMVLISTFYVIKRIRSSQLPRILTKQIKIFIAFIILPYWLIDFLQIYPINSSPTWITNSYTFVSISNILLTIALIYCSRRMSGLRFLNSKPHVQSPVDINFMENFKTTLEQFSHVTNMQELNHITQGFFKEAFSIPLNRTHLYIRNFNAHEQTRTHAELGTAYSIVETFMNTHTKSMCDYLRQTKILIYDEVAFSNFYESIEERSDALKFLEAIQADIFLPIYSRDTLIAYIIVDRHARLDEFYSNAEYDEMLIFASYLSNIINLMQNKNLDTLIQQEKSLQEELYSKHQEINQYKESIRSFLRANKQKEIGIIFYKNRRFTFGNQAAKELIKINPNLLEGHPLTKALKKLATHVESYKSSQTIFANDSDGTRLVFSGVPSLEHNNVIISVHYPEVSDVIKKQIDSLKDPSAWDYLLYLETTKPGKLINHIIPGSGETLLNFKIELLKTALSKKATLLCNMPDQDLGPVVELLHHISLRETLHILDLDAPVSNFEIAIKLFGINPIYGIKTNNAQPILENLDGVGTLFVKNIHFLDLETQEYLAEFIRYGIFRVFKSDQKKPSNVRIICSSHNLLPQLVREGKFSQALFNELKQTILEMPSLITLPEAELNTLAEGFSEQAIANQTYKNLLSLTDKDKHKLAAHRPESLQELKTKVQQLLIQKSKKNQVYNETQFDPTYDISDPELVEVARLGKHALKDQRAMTLLWNKFKNQNKMATFLGVNRSSINRRCKRYNLL